MSACSATIKTLSSDVNMFIIQTVACEPTPTEPRFITCLCMQICSVFFAPPYLFLGWLGSRWLACLTQARVQIAVATLSGNSLRQTVHTHCASVHQATKLVAALLRVAGAAGLTEVMEAYRQVYDSHHLQADCQEPGSAPEPYCL